MYENPSGNLMQSQPRMLVESGGKRIIRRKEGKNTGKIRVANREDGTTVRRITRKRIIGCSSYWYEQ